MANAATITETVDFTASGFSNPGAPPAPAPADPWTGSFTVTFDPAMASMGTLDAFSSSLPAGYGTFVFDDLGGPPKAAVLR